MNPSRHRSSLVVTMLAVIVAGCFPSAPPNETSSPPESSETEPSALPTETHVPSPPTNFTATQASTPSGEVHEVLVLPTLNALQPSEAAPGQTVRILGEGGIILLGIGEYRESGRSFALTFDGQPVGEIECYAIYCYTEITVPAAAPGPHEVSVEGGSTLTLQVTAGPPQATTAPIGPRLVFTSLRDENLDLYVMHADGSGVERLTADRAVDRDCTAAADGTRIAFSSNRALGAYRIYILDLNTRLLTRLLTGPQEERDPAWSPDGVNLALALFSPLDPREADVLVSRLGTAETVRLSDDPGEERSPTWSPNGALVAYASGPYPARDIFVVSADGSRAQVRLTDDPADDTMPAWSPDGTQIAFVSTRGGDEEIYVMNADGSNVRQLTDAEDYSMLPKWSPDGSQIAFQTYRDGNPEIYVMNADGSNPVNLTQSEYGDFAPCWLP